MTDETQKVQTKQRGIQTKSEKIERTDIENLLRFTQQLDMEDSDSEDMQMLSDPSQQQLEGLERQEAEDHYQYH